MLMHLDPFHELDTLGRLAAGRGAAGRPTMMPMGAFREATSDTAGQLRFPASEVAAAARLQRLRAGRALNYAALGVVVSLLDRIAELEAALRTHPQRPGGRTWT